MRTKEELLTLLNPDKAKNVWKYVPVQYTYNIGGTITPYVQLHSIYFNEQGDFQGYNENVESPVGDDIADLTNALNLMLRGCNNPLITQEELTNLVKS